MKKMTLTLIICMFSAVLTAPPNPCIPIVRSEEIKPYEIIWEAVCAVESDFNPKAYFMEQNGCASVGIVQIQQSRVSDFNKQTGKKYTLADCYNPEISKEIFLYYACEHHPNDFEKISRLWNGGPAGMQKQSTLKYWNLIQMELNL